MVDLLHEQILDNFSFDLKSWGQLPVVNCKLLVQNTPFLDGVGPRLDILVDQLNSLLNVVAHFLRSYCLVNISDFWALSKPPEQKALDIWV